MAGAKPARSCILAPNPCSMIQGAPVHAGIPVRAPQILERCSAHHQGQVLSHGSIAPVNLIPAQVVEVGISTFPVEVSSNSGCESWARNLSRPSIAGVITKHVLKSISSPSISRLVLTALSRNDQPNCELRRAKYCALVCPRTNSMLPPSGAAPKLTPNTGYCDNCRSRHICRRTGTDTGPGPSCVVVEAQGAHLSTMPVHSLQRV